MGLIRELVADSALVAATSLYAHWLDANKDLEPDWTWAEVVFGVSACLIHAGVTARSRGQNWKPTAHSLNHLRSFALGGTPVIIGEVWQWRERLRVRAEYSPPPLTED